MVGGQNPCKKRVFDRGCVDAETRGAQITRQIMTYMMEDPRSIPKIMDLVWSVRSLERIGDRCQNIAEYIIYFVNGKDIRHTSQEDIEKSL